MKKFSKILAITLLVIMLVACFVACKQNKDKLTGSVTIVLSDPVNNVDTKEYVIDFKGSNLTANSKVCDLLDYVKSLSSDNKNHIDYTAANGYMTTIGNLVPEGKSYVALYTSVEKDKDVSEWAMPSKTYNNVTVYYSGVGINDMTLEAGVVYYFELTTY